LPSQSRPQQIIDFYAAIHGGDAARVANLFSVWKQSPLYDLDGSDPLTLAAKEGKVEVVKQLLALNVSPNIEAADGYSPLLAALNLDHLEIAAALLKAGADPNNFAYYWDFPLTEAVESRTPGATELLLKYGAKINAIDQVTGQTALHAAVMYRNYEAIQLLLASGANPKIKDEDGKTPIEEVDHDECISHLFSGGKVSDKPTACAPIKTFETTVQFR
jgi:ankyrin repeat protein